MSKLPSISGQECIKALTKIEFYFKRQEGSHIILRRDNPFCQITVPNHKNIDRGALRSIIKQTGLSINDFNDLL